MKTSSLLLLGAAALAIPLVSQADLIDGSFTSFVDDATISRAFAPNNDEGLGWRTATQWSIVDGKMVRENLNPFVQRQFGQLFTDTRTGSLALQFDYENVGNATMSYMVIGVNYNGATSWALAPDGFSTAQATMSAPTGGNHTFTTLAGNTIFSTVTTAPTTYTSPYNLSFSSSSYDAYLVAFSSDGTGSSIDNVSVVPEPSSLALMLISGLGLFALRRRKH